MSGTEILKISLVAIFAANSVLLVAILVIKPLHRRRRDGQRRRRSAYISLLSRHLALESHDVILGRRVAEDQAFLDALIDLRSIVKGPDAEALGTIVDRYEIGARQSERLAQRFRVDTRLRAAVALAELADESAAATLMHHLSDPSPEVRVQCARGLSRIRWKPGIAAILARFETESPWVRSRFADSLIEYGDMATWPLISYVRANGRFGAQGPATAVRTLASIGDPTAVEPLLVILDDVNEPEIQIAIVETLGMLGAPVAFDSVEKAARSEDWRLRAKAASALATLGDESVVPTLALGLEDDNWWVRRNSASALSHFPAGLDVLYGSLLSQDTFARDAAAEALADAGELIAARDRVEGGVGERRDFDLLELVEGKVVTSS